MNGFQCLTDFCTRNSDLVTKIGSEMTLEVGEQDIFLQNTLPQNVITVNKESSF